VSQTTIKLPLLGSGQVLILMELLNLAMVGCFASDYFVLTIQMVKFPDG